MALIIAVWGEQKSGCWSWFGAFLTKNIIKGIVRKKDRDGPTNHLRRWAGHSDAHFLTQKAFNILQLPMRQVLLLFWFSRWVKWLQFREVTGKEKNVAHSSSIRIKPLAPAVMHPEGNAGWRKADLILCFGHSGLGISGRVSWVHTLLQWVQRSLGESLLVFRSPGYWLMTPILFGSVLTYIEPS